MCEQRGKETADLSTTLRFGRDDKGKGCYGPAQVPPLRCAPVQQLVSLEAPPSPLSSRAKRSAVERSLCGYFFFEMFFEPLLELRVNEKRGEL